VSESRQSDVTAAGKLRKGWNRERSAMPKKTKISGRTSKKTRSKKQNGSWRHKTFEEIAAEQGIDPTKTLENVLGKGANLWSSDKEFDEFLAILREAKSQRRN
jgi:hypothetical protein